MPLQSSGAISLANIASEFGGSTPHSISEYYGAASGIPSSGQISFSQFYGASAVVLPSLQVTAYATSWQAPTTGKNAAPAGLRFQSSAAGQIVGALWSSASSGGINMSDYGYFTASGFAGAGMSLMDTSGNPLASNAGSFNKSHGTGQGQYYIRVYYGSSFLYQTTSHTDHNGTTLAPTIGNASAGPVNIANRSSAGSWRIEYYA